MLFLKELRYENRKRERLPAGSGTGVPFFITAYRFVQDLVFVSGFVIRHRMMLRISAPI